MIPISEFVSRAAEHRQVYNRPLVTLSYAQSLDGSLASRRGQPTKISGPLSLQLTHQLRAAHDAISSGTELLLYRGQFPTGIPVDANLPAFNQEVRYPLKYGYAVVGQVIACGSGVPSQWQNRLVFAFQPHTSHFTAHPDELHLLPSGIPPEDAVLFPIVETALNFLMDGKPLIGEHVLVFGQGIVGLLTTALLAMFPLSSLTTIDRYAPRRQMSLALGAHVSLPPSPQQAISSLLPEGADLTFEISGAPAALNQAIDLTGYNGRILIGSWYGSKETRVQLGGSFHRSRIRLISSQVSTIAPEFSGRWSKERRFTLAWEMLRKVKPSHLISQRIPLQHAAQAYQLLDRSPADATQIVFTYNHH